MQIKIVNAATGEEIIRDATPAEEASILTPAPPPDPRRVLDEQEATAAKSNNQVLAFLNMTPDQLDNWIDTNIADPGTRTALKVLGRLAQSGARGRILRN